MADQPSKISKWALRIAVYGGFVAGAALLVSAVTAESPPAWYWAAGIALTLICGALVSVWIAFRIRYSPEQRQQVIADMEAKREVVGRPLDRSRLAYRATKHKKAVLANGQQATAIVTFLADGRRANEFQHLVYLELDVTVPGNDPYAVKTGEFLNPASSGSVAPGKELHVRVDPADPQRVAVDWEKSLRLH